MARRCIFCGSGDTTNAHIFRKGWIDQIYPGTPQFTHWHIRRGEEGFDESWKHQQADIKVKCVCRTCNAGWMDQLDQNAESVFLTNAALGYGAKLGQRDRELIARWCALVSSLLDQLQRVPVLEAEAHRAVYGGRVPRGTSVWMFETQPPPWKIAVWAEPREWRLADDSNVLNAFFVSFGVGRLVVQAYIPTSQTPAGIDLDRSGNELFLRELWPGNLQPLVWPPPQVFPWDQLDEVKEPFEVRVQPAAEG